MRGAREVDADTGLPPPRLDLASRLLNASGGVKPYFVYRYDPRRRAASERLFRASPSSPPPP
jgi:hypothetical protein